MSASARRGDGERMVNRARLREVIVRRPRVGTITGLLLALAFALIVTPIVLAESWAVDPRVAPGQIAPVTVRVGADDVAGVVGARRAGGVIIARGERASEVQSRAVALATADAPRGVEGFAAYGLVLFALAAGFTHHLKRSTRGRLLRVQLVLLGAIALGAAVTKGLLLAYPLSVLAVPVALGAIVPTLVHDRTVGLATGILAAIVMSLLVRFDVGVVTVLIVQAVSTAIVIPERPRPRWTLALAAGAVAMAGAALTYMAFAYLSSRALPFEELATPAASSFIAAGVGGVMAAVLAMPLLPLYERACGEITHRRLVALEDLSHPLLRQIAEKSPGTWQHSLAMANLAEVAAHAIGASGRLVRVGAYFHDLGKSLQPKYFIENLASGEPSPHDALAPEVSCDAIFSHVTEGILLARRHKLPERIIDFMHMHHGDGVLEYFWGKCQDQGNPRHLTVDDFRYPGVPPQSRETAILAVCDAVEAASRTLKRPDARSVENLVQRIVYGKLHLGQLDESGLSMADLRKMSDSLREAIRHAFHDRIEYPWQREAAAEAASAATAATAPVGDARPAASDLVRARASTATQRLMMEPRLDSLDAPRPIQWDDRARDAGASGAMTTPAPPLERASSGPMPRSNRDVAPLGDTLDLAVATTAGLRPAAEAPPVPAASVPVPSVPAASASVPSMPAASASVPSMPAASVGPTADALADAVINAEAPAETSGRRLGTLPRPPTSRMPAMPPSSRTTGSFATPAIDDEAAHAAYATSAEPAPTTTPAAPVSDEDVHRRAARQTEPIVLPTAESRARTALPVPPAATPLHASSPTWAPPLGLARPARDTMVDPARDEGADPARDDDEPEIEIATSADDAVIDEQPAPPPPPAAQVAGREWLGRLSARIDAMLEADEEGDDADDPFAGDTARRPPGPPPRTRPIPKVTQPVEPDDIEASLELSPTLHAPAAGVFVGPPPMTRARRSGVIPVPPAPVADADLDGDDADADRPTVVDRESSGTMLPPRVRRGPDHS